MTAALTLAARAPDDSVHFEPQLPRVGRQQPSLLGCMMACTRELLPVRGQQNNEEKIFPNRCTFDIQRCRANRQRGPPLLLDPNQDNIVYPSVGGK